MLRIYYKDENWNYCRLYIIGMAFGFVERHLQLGKVYILALKQTKKIFK